MVFTVEDIDKTLGYVMSGDTTGPPTPNPHHYYDSRLETRGAISVLNISSLI